MSRTISRSALVALVVMVLLLVSVDTVAAQCAMCKTALTNSPEGRKMVGGLNAGILFLLAAPFASLGTIALMLVRARRRTTADVE